MNAIVSAISGQRIFFGSPGIDVVMVRTGFGA
jgi:hypothetical protein